MQHRKYIIYLATVFLGATPQVEEEEEEEEEEEDEEEVGDLLLKELIVGRVWECVQPRCVCPEFVCVCVCGAPSPPQTSRSAAEGLQEAAPLTTTHRRTEGGDCNKRVNHARRHYYRLGVEPKLCKIRITAKRKKKKGGIESSF